MTFRKFLVLLLTLSLVSTLAIAPLALHGQPQDPKPPTRRGTGRIINAYREETKQDRAANQSESQPQRPAWVEDSLERSFTYLNQQSKQEKASLERVIPDARERFILHRAEQDDLGITHVRLNQIHRGVAVFGKQIITHLDAKGMRTISGKSLDTAEEVETRPFISADQAIERARIVLNYPGKFAQQPKATLVVLPHQFFDEGDSTGATLTYQVELQIMDGTPATAHHEYFVDAKTGRIVWHYDSLASDKGRSLYSGDVSINCGPVMWLGGFVQLMGDSARGGMMGWDANNGNSIPGGLFLHSYVGSWDVWGDHTTNNRESAAVDAFWGAEKSWDYFASRFGRKGYDGDEGQMHISVHYGTNHANAHSKGEYLYFGDGDASSTPWVSLDIVGHEYTHSVTGSMVGLIYAGQSGALNESFSDIFGTAIEFYASGKGNYLLAEQVKTSGLGIRSMADPTSWPYNQPDHYSNRVYQGTCIPQGDDKLPGYNDACGVHTNSGIQNKAFYLLAEGGTHPLSNKSVPGIGRINAETIFYHSLGYLAPDATFADARVATLQAAAAIYGLNSKEYINTRWAWDAVGIKDKSCTYSLSAYEQYIDAKGGLNHFEVNTQSICSPDVKSNVSWIKIGNSFIVEGSNPILFFVDANNQKTSRTGTISVEGKTFTVKQEACSITFQPGATSFTAAGGKGNIAITATGACGWTATSQANWIKIESGVSGAGNGAVTYNVLPTDNQSLRIGTITINGQPVAVKQEGCTVTFQPSLTSFTRLGGSSTITVTATGACGWGAASQVDWIKIEAGASGVGNGQVNFSVAPNINLVARTGTIALAGKLITISQAANVCNITPIAFGQTINGGTFLSDCYSPLGPGAQLVDRYSFTGAAGQEIAIAMNSSTIDSFLRLIGPTGAIIATSDDTMYTPPNARIPLFFFLTLPASGTYVIEAMKAPKAPLKFGDYSLSLSTKCTYQLSSQTSPFLAKGGTGTLNVTTTGNCAWTAQSDVPWVVMATNSGGTGNGRISYTVAPNPSKQARSGTITVSGEKITIQQQGVF